MAGIPARAAYAAAEAEVLPVEAQITACAPSSFAFETATVIPRSLYDPVGFDASHLSHSSGTPSASPRRGTRSSGVEPSPSEIDGGRLAHREPVAESVDQRQRSQRPQCQPELFDATIGHDRQRARLAA